MANGALVAENALADFMARWEAMLAANDQARDDALALAQTLLGALSIVRYVDAVNGDDANSGTQAAPFQTLRRAIDDGPGGGFLEIVALSDVSTQGRCPTSAAAINIRPLQGQRITMSYDIYEDAPGSNTFSSHFVVPGQGHPCALALHDVDLQFPADVAPGATLNASALIASGHGGPHIGLSFDGCTLSVPADCPVTAIAAQGRVIHLAVVGTTVPAEMSGRWMTGVAAGTDPATLSHVLTNLATL